MNLIEKKCTPCEGGVPKLSSSEAGRYLGKVSGWELNHDLTAIFKNLRLENFVAAVDLIQKIALVAEGEGHHPDLHLTGYRNLQIEISTHAIGGLTENDFILAAKIDRIK